MRQPPSRNPSFIDRYRWYLFLGSFGVNAVMIGLRSAIPELAGMYSIVNILSAIPLVMGIAGFVSHARHRRWIEADEQYRKAQSKGEQS